MKSVTTINDLSNGFRRLWHRTERGLAVIVSGSVAGALVGGFLRSRALPRRRRAPLGHSRLRGRHPRRRRAHGVLRDRRRTGGASPSPNAQVPPGRTPPPGPGPGGAGDGGDRPIRRTGTVVVVPGSSHDIDLDSLAPSWTTSAARSRVNDLEFRIADRRLVAVDPAVVANLPAGGKGTWRECATQQSYAEDGRPETGALMCVITTERRYALLRVTSVHHTDGLPDRIGLDIKVWDARNAS
ncbi:hypothetical protein ACIBI3_16050 [Actinomadura luteofluorescens]|uniref:hypothetical protein n=1 Tax=Actinomadura luteofluorescens TaxID=46163 RepID=UPI0034828E9E